MLHYYDLRVICVYFSNKFVSNCICTSFVLKKNGQMLPRVQKFALKVVLNLSWSLHKLSQFVSKLFKVCLKDVLKLPQSDPKVAPKWPESCPKLVSSSLQVVPNSGGGKIWFQVLSYLFGSFLTSLTAEWYGVMDGWLSMWYGDCRWHLSGIGAVASNCMWIDNWIDFRGQR